MQKLLKVLISSVQGRSEDVSLKRVPICEGDDIVLDGILYNVESISWVNSPKQGYDSQYDFLIRAK